MSRFDPTTSESSRMWNPEWGLKADEPIYASEEACQRNGGI